MPIIKPLGNRVLIQIAKPEEKQGLIFFNAEVKKDRGIVLGIGPDVTYVNKGDLVMINQYSGTSVGEECVIMKEDEIMAVME